MHKIRVTVDITAHHTLPTHTHTHTPHTHSPTHKHTHTHTHTHTHKRSMYEEFRNHVKRTPLGIKCIVIYKDVFHCNYT